MAPILIHVLCCVCDFVMMKILFYKHKTYTNKNFHSIYFSLFLLQNFSINPKKKKTIESFCLGFFFILHHLLPQFFLVFYILYSLKLLIEI
jgi:hypothetical protein